MIIDFHVHTFPEAIAARAVGGLQESAGVPPYTDGTVEALSASLERAGMDRALLLPVATNPKHCSRINDTAASQNGMGRLLSFGAIHPDCPDWKQELARVQALGLRGVKLHPFFQNTDFDDPRYLRILDRAGELGLVVVTHAGLDVGFPGQVRCSPEMILRAVRQVGPVKLVLAHMGGWKNWDRVEALLPETSVYLDTAFSCGTIPTLPAGQYAGAPLRLLDEAAFLRMVRLFGADRILFGTDSPWSDQRQSLAWMQALELPEAQKAAILGGNAARLLGLQT